MGSGRILRRRLRIRGAGSRIYSRPVMFGICDQEADAERYELKLHCVKEGTQVRAELRYDNAVYDATAMERVLACYQNVVRSACGGSAEVLRDVERGSEAARQ